MFSNTPGNASSPEFKPTAPARNALYDDPTRLDASFKPESKVATGPAQTVEKTQVTRDSTADFVTGVENRSNGGWFRGWNSSGVNAALWLGVAATHIAAGNVPLILAALGVSGVYAISAHIKGRYSDSEEPKSGVAGTIGKFTNSSYVSWANAAMWGGVAATHVSMASVPLVLIDLGIASVFGISALWKGRAERRESREAKAQ